MKLGSDIMLIGAYQFSGSGDPEKNLSKIETGVMQAYHSGVRFLVFHECALNGYPPIEVKINDIDFEKSYRCLQRIRSLAVEYNMYLAVGCITKSDIAGDASNEQCKFLNTIKLISPNGNVLTSYGKRALWGWDMDNFTEGDNSGIFEIEGLKIGLRICFEVRFPEYFRELYKTKADLAVVSFCDISSDENTNRYELIKSHLRTRAVENLLPILSVNNCKRYQTAPTAFFDKDGNVICECNRNEEQLLIYNFEKSENNFGQLGRKYINDKLL